MSIKTAIFLAVAMAALRNPLRPANRIAQDFRAENLLTFRIKVDADSTSSDRIALSPRFDMRPDQSISPDWYRLGVRPRYPSLKQKAEAAAERYHDSIKTMTRLLEDKREDKPRKRFLGIF